MKVPDKWVAKEKISAKKLNQSRDAIQQIMQQMAGDAKPGREGVGRGRLAIIATYGPAEESNFTDARYWVTFADADSNTSNNGQPDSLLTATKKQKADGTAVEEVTVVATNLAEVGVGGHTLRTNTNVWVFPVWGTTTDASTPSTLRWVFSQSRTPSPFVVNLSSDGGSANPVSYTYTATDPVSNTTLGTSLTPVYRPIAGNVPTAATLGLADYGGTNGAFRLIQAYEAYGSSECP